MSKMPPGAKATMHEKTVVAKKRVNQKICSRMQSMMCMMLDYVVLCVRC
jgi:hypothetical protein